MSLLPYTPTNDAVQSEVEIDQTQPTTTKQSLQRTTTTTITATGKLPYPTAVITSASNENTQNIAVELSNSPASCRLLDEKSSLTNHATVSESSSNDSFGGNCNDFSVFGMRTQISLQELTSLDQEVLHAGLKPPDAEETEIESRSQEWHSDELTQHLSPPSQPYQMLPDGHSGNNSSTNSVVILHNQSSQPRQATQEEGKKRMNTLLLELSADSYHFGNLNLKKRKDISECHLPQHSNEQTIQSIKNEFIALDQGQPVGTKDSCGNDSHVAGKSCTYPKTLSDFLPNTKALSDFLPNASLKIVRRPSDPTLTAPKHESDEGKESFNATSVDDSLFTEGNAKFLHPPSDALAVARQDRDKLPTSYTESFGMMDEGGVFESQGQLLPLSSASTATAPFDAMEDDAFYDSKLLYSQQSLGDDNSFLMKEGGDLLPFLHPISALSQTTSSFDFLSKPSSVVGCSSEIQVNSLAGNTLRDDQHSHHSQQFYDIKHRKRTSREQLVVLERSFTDNSRPTSEQRKQLAVLLDMTPRGVQIWFQNRRAKLKAKTRDEEHFNSLRKNKEGFKNGNQIAPAIAVDHQYFAGNAFSTNPLMGNPIGNSFPSGSVGSSFRIDPFYQQHATGIRSDGPFPSSALVSVSGKQNDAFYHQIGTSHRNEPPSFSIGPESKNEPLLDAFGGKHASYNGGHYEQTATNEWSQREQGRNGFKISCPFSTISSTTHKLSPAFTGASGPSEGFPVVRSDTFSTSSETAGKSGVGSASRIKNDSLYHPIRDVVPSEPTKTNPPLAPAQLPPFVPAWSTSSGVKGSGGESTNCYPFFPSKPCLSSAGTFGNILTPERSPSNPLSNVPHSYGTIPGTSSTAHFPHPYHPTGKDQKPNSYSHGNHLYPSFPSVNQMNGTVPQSNVNSFPYHQYSSFPVPIGYKNGFNYQYYPNGSRLMHPTIVYPNNSMHFSKQHPLQSYPAAGPVAVFPKPSNIYQVPFSSGNNKAVATYNQNAPLAQSNAIWPSQWNMQNKSAIDPSNSRLPFNPGNIASLPELSFVDDKTDCCSSDVMKDIEAAILNAPFELDNNGGTCGKTDAEGKTNSGNEQNHFDSFVEELHQTCTDQQQYNYSQKQAINCKYNEGNDQKDKTTYSQFGQHLVKSFNFDSPSNGHFTTSCQGSSEKAVGTFGAVHSCPDSIGTGDESSFEGRMFRGEREGKTNKEDSISSSNQSSIFKEELLGDVKQNFAQFSELFEASCELSDLLIEKQPFSSSIGTTSEEASVRSEQEKNKKTAFQNETLLLSEYLND